MKKNFYIALTIVIILSLGLVGYGVYVNYAGESTIMDRMANRSITINAAVVKERPINAQYIVQQAGLEARDAFDVIAKVDGVIINSNVHKNKLVAVGDMIVELQNEEIPLRISSALSAVQKAKAVKLQAENSYNRYLKLIEVNATSLEKLDEARANYEASVAEVEDAEARYDQAVLLMDRLHVTSPAAGNVVVLYKQPGSYVTAGTPICMVADFKSMWFAVNMTDEEIKALFGNMGMRSTFSMRLPSMDKKKAYSTEYSAGNRGLDSSFPVTIQGVYPGLEMPASMRRVVFNVDNKSAVLEPQVYNRLVLTADVPRKVLSIDSAALFDTGMEDNYQQLFVVREDNTLEQRKVVVGASDGTYTEILSGLQPGEKVIISGTDGLADGQVVEINYLEDN